MNSYTLKTFLEKLYTQYKCKFSSEDPVWILHGFKNKSDIEIAGLISSCYTFGFVKQINAFLSSLFKSISFKPYEFTINFSKHKDKKYLEGFNYRFIKDHQLVRLFNRLKDVLRQNSSLENVFFNYYSTNRKVEDSIKGFLWEFRSCDFGYLFPKPDGNSAFKRMNLFLRWMVRKDEIDLGVWDKIPISELIIPVDVHIARVSKKLRLVGRKSIDLKFAVELTKKLKEFDPQDPVKYDFALCHAAMEGRLNNLGRI